MRFRFHYGIFILGVAAAGPLACGDDGDTVYVSKIEPDADGDGWPASLDCDDHDDSIFPAADEIPGDGIDQDCSGSDAEGLGGVGGGGGLHPGTGGGGNPDAWVDEDGDGWPKFADCNDKDAGISPAAREVPFDGIDQDCDGADLTDLDGDGFDGGPDGEDCDDALATVHPGRLEIALDGIDQDCDGSDLIGTDAFIGIAPVHARPGSVPYLASGNSQDEQPVALAAWADSRNAPRQDIYARFLGADGKPKGSEFPIETGGLAKANVRVVWNGESYLVTWDQEDGVWARQVDRSGAGEGALLGIAPAGGVSSRAAWGGANWGIVWATNDGQVRSRGVSSTGVRSEIHLVATPGFVSAPGLAAHDGAFLVAWAEQGGIRGRPLSATGLPASDVMTISSERNLSNPAIVELENGYLVAFRRGGGTASVRAQVVGADLAVSDPAVSLRLSADSFALADIHVASGGDRTFIAWNDDRHRHGALAYGAIYANTVSLEGVVGFPGDAGLHVDLTAELGGVAVIGTAALVATRVGDEVGVVVRHF